jgi:lysophospholipase L1-like esterase
MKVVLIGDSIRGGYQALVKKKCEGMEVWAPQPNCRHSVWALDHFQEWVADQKPDVVHVNFGIHDAVLMADGQHQILLPQYRLCLQRYIDQVKARGNTKMIWATTTPLYEPDKEKPMKEWRVVAKAEIKEYNAAALEIVKGAGVPVNDLHEVVMRNDFTKCISADGCHMTEFGNEVLSDAVVKAIREVK